MSVNRKLKAHFARYGIPEQLVTDNGPQFASRDFLKFAKKWDFEHLASSPHHSQSNGKAESAVKKAKKLLRKCKSSGSDAFLALLDQPTGVQISLAQRLFSRRTWGLLPMTASLLAPQVIPGNELYRARLKQRKERQAYYYNRVASDLDPLQRGDTVTISVRQAGVAERNCARSAGREVVRGGNSPVRCSAKPCPPAEDE